MNLNNINSNDLAVVIRGNINKSTKGLSNVMERLSSGLRINSARDDAAGMAIATRMSVQLNGIRTAQNNLQDGMAMLNLASSTLTGASAMLQRLRGLCVQNLNGSLSEKERDMIRTEADNIVAELERTQTSTKYKDSCLFNNMNDHITSNLDQYVNGGASPDVPDGGDPAPAMMYSMRSSSPVFESSGGEEETTPEDANVNIDDNNENTISLTSLDEEENSEVPMMMNSPSNIPMMFAAAPASAEGGEPVAQSETLSGAFDFAKGEQYNIEIDGITYTVKNDASYESCLSYTKDVDTQTVTFIGNSFTITCQSDVSHNIVVNGKNNKIYGGDLSDTFTTLDTAATGNVFYGKGGADYFNLYTHVKAVLPMVATEMTQLE